MMGDLTGLMGETDSLAEGETGLQTTQDYKTANFMHYPVIKSKQISQWGRRFHNSHYFCHFGIVLQSLQITILIHWFQGICYGSLSCRMDSVGVVLPDGCGRRPFHMSDRWRWLLASSRCLGNEGRRGLGGRLWGNAWRGFVSQMLSHHSSSFDVHLHHGGALETGLHLLRRKHSIMSSGFNEKLQTLQVLMNP